MLYYQQKSVAMSKDTNNNNDACPNSDIGVHRYFIFKTVECFERVEVFSELGTLYVKNEYALLGCNCGSVVKTEVKQDV